jgi:hypothetical protein
MSERIIKTGLSPHYKDMLDAVIGQMSDGYWENTPMMRGYWKFVTTGTAGNEVTLNVDEVSGARDGDRRIENRFYGMSDDAVKKFFADKIKFLIKEEGLGKWDRGNESETDYLSYGKPRYRVKDCYYAYEVLKGRDARKHPEYGDVEESRQPVKIKLVEKNEGHWIYRLLDAFGFTISNKSSDKNLVALKNKDTGVDTPSGITLTATFYWETEGLSTEVYARRYVNLGDASIPDIFYTFIGKDASGGVNENIARSMLVDLDEAATLYAKALRVGNGQRG